jgi:hypothetical protein
MAGSDVKSVHLTADTTAADADGVCQSQTPAGGGSQDITINGAQASGGVASFDAGRLITITSAGADQGRTFTITGTDVNGDAQTETITGPNTTTVTGTAYFKTVTTVNVDDDTAGAITVGMSADAADVIFRERARLKGAFIVNAATAGVVTFLSGSPTGTVKLKLGTVASATAERDVTVPSEGIMFEDGAYITYTGGTNEIFTNMTLFHA